MFWQITDQQCKLINNIGEYVKFFQCKQKRLILLFVKSKFLKSHKGLPIVIAKRDCCFVAKSASFKILAKFVIILVKSQYALPDSVTWKAILFDINFNIIRFFCSIAICYWKKIQLHKCVGPDCLTWAAGCSLRTIKEKNPSFFTSWKIWEHYFSLPWWRNPF